MPHEAKREHFGEIVGVVTVPTICRLWSVHKNTVYYNIDAGNLVAVKDGRVWLVSVSSVVELWGMPIAELLLAEEDSCWSHLTEAT